MPLANQYRGVLLASRQGQPVARLPGDFDLPVPGELIPESLRAHCDLVIAEAADWLQTAPRCDFAFQDLDHCRTTTAHVTRLVVERLNPGGVLVCHDALHPRYGRDVRRGLADAGLRSVVCLRVAESDCGFAVWRKPEASSRDRRRRHV
jgi:hypothetical protein